MKRLAWLLPLLAACGGGSSFSATFSDGTGGAGAAATGGTAGPTGSGGSGAGAATSTVGSASTTSTGGSATATGGSGGTSVASATSSTGGGVTCGTCPSGYTCGTANGIPVCRAPSGIPMFSNVFLIVMENTSLSTLQAAMTSGAAPNLKAMAATYATGSAYHGVAHPSLPNYIALTSGGTQGTGCDCTAGGTANCTFVSCTNLYGLCSCPNTATNIADQLEAAHKTWMAFGEDMATPCNTTDGGNYAQRHVPFLYYTDIQTNAARCKAHVVDFGNFLPATAAAYNFIAPNLVDDMHNPDPTNATNIPDGDTWIGPQVTAITAASTYKKGGLLVVVWDEDDGSGGLLGDTDDPIEIFVLSPYAKAGGYVSAAKANHYSLLATLEDGLGLPRLGMAASPGSGVAATLADYFPAN
jgi:phosphatidylinositol-3-phosphatase